MSFIKENNYNLKPLTYVKIGGVAKTAFFPTDKEGVSDVFKLVKKERSKFFILGGASNVVIRDGFIDYDVIISNRLVSFFVDKNILFCESGLSTERACEIALDNGLSGLEFLYGLPGSIGGAVFMNARSYGFSISDVVKSVEVYDYEKDVFLTLSKEDCDFDYKRSIFQKKPYFIYRVALNLKPKNYEDIKTKMFSFKEDRNKKGQYIFPSAGCAFKNNYSLGTPSGKLIDELGLKGISFGGIKVYEKHANFLVNIGNASFDDYKKAVDYIKSLIKEKKGVELECEVVFLP